MGTKNKREARAVVRLLGYEKEVIRSHPELRGKLDPEKVDKIAGEAVEILQSGEWSPHPYRHMRKRSQSTGKIREIDCPTLRDHIVHWMIILATKPVIMRGMYYHACGSIPGRGIERARKTIEKWAREEKSVYFVKLDIRKFYQNIDHSRLKAAFLRVMKDKKMLDIIFA